MLHNMMARVKGRVLEDNEDLQKFIILLIDVNDEPIRGGLKFQKMMFLVCDGIKNIYEQIDYDSDSYGPYAEMVGEELNYLNQVGVLTESKEEIALTNQGKKILKEIKKDTTPNIIKALSEYKEFLNDLTDDEILAFFYTAYPALATVVVNLKQDIEPPILSLIKKEKISRQRACELLDKPLTYINKQMN